MSLLAPPESVFATLALAPGNQQAFDALLENLEAQHHGTILGVLVYGSCLRSNNIFDGLVDLYLLCTQYRDAYPHLGLAVANRVLPPNVFYAEHRSGERVLRSKVSVISLADFQRTCSDQRFESYFWGRFAQPVALPRVRDDATREAISRTLRSAATTLLKRSLPVLPATGTVTELWMNALQLSYATELRTERPGRARELVADAGDFYLNAAMRAARDNALRLTIDTSGKPARYTASYSKGRRLRSHLAWTARRILGKTLSVLRLVKALFTFQGGLDYIAWKLQRHSGETIEIPARVRRRPLIYSWGFFWKLYRRGVFK